MSKSSQKRRNRSRPPRFLIFDARGQEDGCLMSTAYTYAEASERAADYGIGTMVVSTKTGRVVYRVPGSVTGYDAPAGSGEAGKAKGGAGG